jgi:hypothetical protein
LEKTGNSGSHKVLTCPVFPAKLDTKKPATIEEAGEVLHTEKVEPAVSDTPLKGPVFTRVFEEFLLLYPRLHPY